MKIYSIVVLFLNFNVVFGQIEELLPNCNHTAAVEHKYYSLCYVEEHKQASWVIYELKSERSYGSVERSNNFRSDSKVSSESATLSDYKGSGYDRGHLVPAADMSFNAIAMSESFFLSNMSPQNPSFNRGIWKRGEELVRTWRQLYSELIVITGPIFTNKIGSIGPNNVTVPRAYYKIIYHYNISKKEHQSISFIMPNKKGEYSLNHYMVSIDEIEQKTGIDFFYKLSQRDQMLFEDKIDISNWPLTLSAIQKPKSEDSNSSADQCHGITQKNERCKRRTTSSSGFCWQHD